MYQRQKGMLFNIAAAGVVVAAAVAGIAAAYSFGLDAGMAVADDAVVRLIEERKRPGTAVAGSNTIAVPTGVQNSRAAQDLAALRAELTKLQEWASGLEAEAKKKDAALAAAQQAVHERDQKLSEAQKQLDQYRFREGMKKKVMFLQGIDSSSTGQNFNPLAEALANSGFNYRELMWWSYAGGDLNGLGQYVPAPYGCAETRVPLAGSVQRLRVFLDAYREVRPDTEIVLVGHSLGGLLALKASLGYPVRVVTLDSPLQGVRFVSGRVFAWFSSSPCADHQAPVLSELDRRLLPWPLMNSNVLNVGSRTDCLYNVSICHAVGGALLKATCTGSSFGCGDMAETQVVPGALFYWAALPQIIDEGESHRAVLRDPATLQRIVQFIGPPR